MSKNTLALELMDILKRIYELAQRRGLSQDDVSDETYKTADFWLGAIKNTTQTAIKKYENRIKE